MVTDAIIVAIIFYFVYRILENLIHRKERLIVAQKIETLDPQKNGQIDLNKWFGAVATNKYAPMRWGLLLIGAAFGLVLAFLCISQSSRISDGTVQGPICCTSA